MESISKLAYLSTVLDVHGCSAKSENQNCQYELYTANEDHPPWKANVAALQAEDMHV